MSLVAVTHGFLTTPEGIKEVQFPVGSFVKIPLSNPDPPWIKPKIGVIGSNESAFQTINTQIGYGTCRRSYNTTLPVSWEASAAASDVAAGRESLWSWKPSVTGFVGSSTQQNAFSAFLDTIPAGHPCIIMAVHEPENDIPADFSFVQWADLQNAVAAIVKSKNRPELRTAFCIMGPWTFDTRNPEWDDFNWEAEIDFNLIDVVGIDPYRTADGSTMTLQTLLTVNNSGSGTGGSAPSMMAKLASWGKPISIMEWGAYFAGTNVAPESNIANFITTAYDWAKIWNQTNPLTPIIHMIWYSMTILSPPEDTPLTGQEISAYAAINADSKIPVPV